MKKPDQAVPKSGSDRRDFLKLAALSAPVAVAATAATGTAEAAEVDPTSSKMQDTAHTRAYFDSARF
ncbi:hypothetical protein [Labrenzia sp. DG1229]|uniref:hypothetical protein n=1 Tax=Labrenzia sp. DG1229 TaxID=681847 RepID=UPI0004921827|nr:hypothetical protein [Labrenzia sp. DG1229]